MNDHCFAKHALGRTLPDGRIIDMVSLWINHKGERRASVFVGSQIVAHLDELTPLEVMP